MGLVTLTATNAHEDRLKGSYAGGAFYWDPIIPDETSAALPTAPSLLAAGTPTSNSIPMTWQDNASNESGFEVWRSDDGGTNYSRESNSVSASASTGGTVSYTSSSLSPSTQHYYKVRAFNTGGFSSYNTTPINATTSSGAPTAELVEWHLDEASGKPVNPTGSTTPGTMTIDSRTSSVEFGSGPGAFVSLAGMTQSTVTVTANVTGSTSYTYKVSAFASDGTHNLQSVGGAITNGAATTNNHISWTTVTPTPAYYVVYRTVSAGTPNTTGNISGNLVPATVCSGGTCTFDDINTAVVTAGNNGTGLLNNIYQINADNAVDYETAPSTGYSQTTISFWVKSTFAPSATAEILNNGNADFSIAVNTANKLIITMKGSSGSQVVTTPTTSINNGTTWYNVIVVLDNSTLGNTPSTISQTTTGASDNIRVYINGTQVACTTTGVSRVGPFKFTSSKPRVGSSASAAAPWFVGNVDDVRIYNRIISGAEITAIVSGHAQ